MRNVAVVDGVHLRLDEDQQVDPVAVGRLLTESCHQAWAGLDLPGETALADLDLWLAAGPTADVAGTFVVPTAQPAAVETNLVAPAWRFGAPAILLAGTFGYRSALRWSNGRFDLGPVPTARTPLGWLGNWWPRCGTNGTPAWFSPSLLQRRVEPREYTAIWYRNVLIDVQALASIGTVGDSYDMPWRSP